MAALEEIMTTALKTNKVKFVEVLMENGVSMGRYLTVRRLENLYREAAKKPKTIMNHLLGVNELQDFTIDDIGMILTEICGIDLMKDLGNTIGLNKDTGTHKFSVVAGLRYSGMQLESFDRPYNALFIWAVLNNLQEMAMLFWQEGCEILSHALIACKLYKRMSDIATRMGLPDEIADEMDRNGREFEDLSVSLLDHCYNTDEKRARHLLTYELKHWGKLTSLILAADAEHEEFVAHSCCQTLLTSIWKGALKLKTNESLKTIACLAFPPLVLALDFCSERELYENVLTRDRHKDRNKMPSKQTNQYAEENPDMVLLNFEGHVIEVSHQRESDDFKKRNGKRASFIIPSEKPFLDERSRDDPGTLKWWQKYREFYSAPITKFWMNVTVYIVFLMMFIYVVLVKLGPWPTVQEWIVIVLIVSFTTEEFRQLLDTEASTFKEKLRDWSASVWNLLDSVAILFFYVGLFLRFQSNPNTVLIGHAIYAIDVMLWIIRLLDIFSVNRYLGPYVVMIGRMTIDLAYFLFVMVIFFIAYGVGRQAILEPQAQASWRALRDMSYIPFLQIFGELQVEKFEGKESNKTVFGTQVRTPYGESITIVLMGIYLLIVNVLLLNLLIAVFNNTYSEIQAKSKKVWKFTRYHIIMEYTFRPALLPPFVIFSHLYAFLIYICSKFHCLKCCRKLCKFPKHSRAVLKSTMRESELRDLRTFEEECLTNMMRKRELIIEGTQDEKLDSMTHSISSVKEKIETIGDENWAREERQKNGIQVILSKFNELENEREGITSTMNALQETLGSCFETIRGLKEESSRVKTQLAQSQNELEKLSTSIKEHKWQEEHSSPHDGSPEELHADESLVKRSHEEASPADTNEGVKMTVRTLPKRTQPRAASVSPKSTEPKEPIKVEANSDLPLKKDSTPYLIDWNLVSGTEDMPQIREQAVIASQSDSDDETEDSNEHKEVEKQSEKEDEEIKEISEREPVYYPLSTVERFPVTDTSVSWEVGYPEYDPQNYTSEIVLSGPSWADPDLTSENAVAFKFNETDENADRRSFEGMYDVVEGFPRNPRGRTGVKGRGNLGRWGPNHMVELFITRWKQSKGGLKILRGGKRVLEILAMKTKAESELALPSGMVKAGEQLPVLIGKVFSADAVNRLQLGQPLKDKMKEELALIFQHGKELFKGYSEDERNTDNAWVEILITNYHDEEGDVFRHFPVKGYIGSTNLYWQEVSGNIALGNWHKSLLLEVAKTLDAHF